MTFVVLVVLCLFASALCTPLEDYVNKPDPSYSWYDTGFVLKGLGWKGYLLNMTSQTWLTTADVDRSLWTHNMLAIVPDKLRSPGFAGIYATGKDNDGPPNQHPRADDEDVLVGSFLAVNTGTVVCVLWQIPNQHLVFPSDPEHKRRSEDSAVAWTWLQYMKHQDRPEWIIYFPMVKAVFRAMDTIDAFVLRKTGLGIQKFLLAGASKRGWITWLSGAVDKGERVIGIVPIVMDMLNLHANILHMYRSYGGWTFAFEDYWNLNITTLSGTPEFLALTKQIDPLFYKDSLTMPKLVVDATGDEFFMPDDDWFWWGQLKGETYRLMVQNAEHSMATGILEVLPGVDAFYQSLIDGSKRPQFDWTRDSVDGTISVTTCDVPTEVRLWHADTLDDSRRDFRLVTGDTAAHPCKYIKLHQFGHACLNPVIWFSRPLLPHSVEHGCITYKASMSPPRMGWRAFFVELKYPAPSKTVWQYRLTTQVSIVPDEFPFPACEEGPDCKGVLV